MLFSTYFVQIISPKVCICSEHGKRDELSVQFGLPLVDYLEVIKNVVGDDIEKMFLRRPSLNVRCARMDPNMEGC